MGCGGRDAPIPSLTQGCIVLCRVGTLVGAIHAGNAGSGQACTCAGFSCCSDTCSARQICGAPVCTPASMATATTWLGGAETERLRALTEDPTAAWAVAVEAGARSDRLASDALVTKATAGGLRFVCISDTHSKHFALPELPEGELAQQAARRANG